MIFKREKDRTSHKLNIDIFKLDRVIPNIVVFLVQILWVEFSPLINYINTTCHELPKKKSTKLGHSAIIFQNWGPKFKIIKYIN